MAADDAARWDARYAGRPVAEPSPPEALDAAGLFDIVPTSGRALDVACGAGGQAAWLGARGLDVLAIDASPVAIELALRAAAAAGVTHRVDARVVDLDRGIDADFGDFDVIVCQRFRAIDLYGSFVERLHDGGICATTVLSRTGADSPGPFHAPSGELRSAFDRPDTDVLVHVETDGHESIVIRKLPR